MIEVLHLVFFAPSSPITVQYPDCFKLDDRSTLKLTPSMVALAATAVHHYQLDVLPLTNVCRYIMPLMMVYTNKSNSMSICILVYIRST